CLCFFFQAEDGIRDFHVTGVQTCALPIYIVGSVRSERCNRIIKYPRSKSTTLQCERSVIAIVRRDVPRVRMRGSVIHEAASRRRTNTNISNFTIKGRGGLGNIIDSKSIENRRFQRGLSGPENFKITILSRGLLPSPTRLIRHNEPSSTVRVGRTGSIFGPTSFISRGTSEILQHQIVLSICRQ